MPHPWPVPLYMDRHEFATVTAEQIAADHLKDLETQGRFGVQFLTYWFDDVRKHTFCLASAPDRESVEKAHRASHGGVPTHVIEVDEGAIYRFMGGVANHRPGEPYVETAFRTILFTDIEGSTALTQELGDARAMALVRRHDEIVGSAIARFGGSEVKHTGDGLMASFVAVTGGIRSAIEIQQQLAVAELDDPTHLGVRVGLAAGEPVTERDDLFGAAVQLAARLCQRARPGSILVSSGVQGLSLGKGFTFRKRGSLRLKGFEEPVPTFEVAWEEPA